MPDTKTSLGLYEKQVLLELDNSLSLHEIRSIQNQDHNFRLLFSIIHNSWEQQQSIDQCIDKVHYTLEPALYSVPCP